MKKIILFFALVSGLTFMACNNSESASATESAPEKVESSSTDNIVVNGLENATPPPPPAAAQGASANGEKHYICPNNCEGSGGDSGGTCPTCGATYVHNAAFHAQQNNLGTPQNTPGSIMTNPQAQTPEPAQNANGVWHYTCPNGCAGGGGTAGPCPSCGATMVHNATYHQ